MFVNMASILATVHSGTDSLEIEGFGYVETSKS